MPADTTVNPTGLELHLLEAQPSDGAEVVTLDAQPLPAGADSATPPAEVRLLPAGTFRTTKGNFKFDAESAKTVLAAAADWGNEYCFDMGHAMVAPSAGMDPADAERAYGWYRLKVNAAGELVTDGLKWTDRGASMLTKREVRYISPAIRTNRDGRVVEFINAALTNIPATKGMRPIVASRTPTEEHPTMDPILLAALGLSKAANDTEALGAVQALAAFKKEITALTGEDDEKSVETVASWKARAGEVAGLTAQVAEMKRKKNERKVLELVDEAIKAKKMPPSLKEKMVEFGRKDRKLLKAYLKDLPVISAVVPGAGEKKGEAGDVSTLTKEELEVCKTLSIDPKVFAKTKAGGVVESELKPKDEGAAAGDATATK